jgi:hypothetical protein
MSKKINFGTDFSGATTTGPIQSMLLAFLSSGPKTLREITETRDGFRNALRKLVARGLVEERESATGVIRFALSTKAARQIAADIREAPLKRRFGVVVSGVSPLDERRLRDTVTFR